MKRSLLAPAAVMLSFGGAQADTGAVLTTYADIAQATFEDSLTTAQALQQAVAALVAAPSDAALENARLAWKAARVPYQQSEVFRFGNAIVDEWEGKVNAWPLDEGLIDYVDEGTYVGPTDENEYAALNVVANPVFQLGGAQVDATEITPALLETALQEADGIETNVATGYHAIEFMLWGQDLNGTGPGAGARPWTDYASGEACTNGNCDRRAAYLVAATDLLVSDLAWMVAQWQPGGAARAAAAEGGLSTILTGMGSLSYGELAGERMRLGLLLNDPEEEQDCFSDNTHNSHFYDGVGIRNVYVGAYTRVDGSVVSGPSLADLVAATDATLNAELVGKLDTTVAALGEMKAAADAGFAYDQMLGRGDERGETLIMAGVNGLVDQTKSIERVVAALGLDQLEIEGSDSLDAPGKVAE